MPTIAQAQAAFLNAGGLSGGTDKGKVYIVKRGNKSGKANFSQTGGQLGVMQAMIAQYISEFLTTAADNLKKTNSITTGNLVDSLDFDVTTNSTGYTINFKALDYFRFVDKGVRGAGSSRKNSTSPYVFKHLNPSKSHVIAIEKWIIRNRLTATARDVRRSGATGRESKAIDATRGRRSLAYAIAKGIKKDGLYATNFWTDAFDDVFKDFGAQMSKALGKSITINLEQLADDFGNFKGVNIPGI